jgi:hypothetical protein
MCTSITCYHLTHQTPPLHILTSVLRPLQAIKRLQDVAVGVVAPYAELLAKPLVGSVAVVDLADIAKSGLPPLPAGKTPPSLLPTSLTYLSHVYGNIRSVSA